MKRNRIAMLVIAGGFGSVMFGQQYPPQNPQQRQQQDPQYQQQDPRYQEDQNANQQYYDDQDQYGEYDDEDYSDEYSDQGYDVPPPPPAPNYAYNRSPMPGPGYSWIDGYWGFGAGRYSWVGGNWRVPPFAGGSWFAPRYAAGRYYAGYWRGNRSGFNRGFLYSRPRHNAGFVYNGNRNNLRIQVGNRNGFRNGGGVSVRGPFRNNDRQFSGRVQTVRPQIRGNANRDNRSFNREQRGGRR